MVDNLLLNIEPIGLTHSERIDSFDPTRSHSRPDPNKS